MSGFFAPSAIYVMNADGSEQRRLAGNVAWSAPAWSPDGRKIAFTRYRPNTGWEIYVVNADGSGERRLTSNAGRPVPAWSPDGRKIAFVGGVGRGRHNSEIYVVNADGTDLRRLTHNTRGDSKPAWSPDGRRIALERNWQVWVMNADGSGQRRLTRAGARHSAAAWSPDGRKIAFERRLGKPCHNRCTGPREPRIQLWVMNADGSGQRMLTRRGAEPSWSPDGRRIAFTTTRDGNPEIYAINADGSAQRNLTRTADRRETQPVWSPLQR